MSVVSPETYTATVTVTDDDSGSRSTKVVYTVASGPVTLYIPSVNHWEIIVLAVGLAGRLFGPRTAPL